MAAGTPIMSPGLPAEDFKPTYLPKDDDKTPYTYDKYDWQYYYEAPKWKDFDASKKLTEQLDSAPPPPPRKFTDATPGQIMSTLIKEAHARGAIREITYDFNAKTDSAGNLWPTSSGKLIDHKFDPGMSLLAVAEWMVEENVAHPRMNGRTLQLFVPSYTVVRDVVLAKGKNLLDGPRAHDGRSEATHAYVISESGVHGWVKADEAPDNLDRIESVVNINSVTTWSAAETRGKNHLKSTNKAKTQYTYGLVPDKSSNPYTDFFIGDTVTVMDDGVPVSHRVRQIALNWDDNSAVSIVLTMADKIESKAVKAAKQLRAQAGKTGQLMAKTTTLLPDKALSDGVAPEPPSTPIVTTKAGTVQITWDGKDNMGEDPVWDQAGVEVHVSDDPEFEPDDTTRITTLRSAGAVTLNDIEYGAENVVKFVAVDEAGDRSPQSEHAAVTIAKIAADDIEEGAVPIGPTEAPASTPEIVAVATLNRALMITMPPQTPFERYKVEVSKNNTFTDLEQVVTSWSNVVTVSPLPAFTDLWVRVSLANDVGEAPPSAAAGPIRTLQLEDVDVADLTLTVKKFKTSQHMIY